MSEKFSPAAIEVTQELRDAFRKAQKLRCEMAIGISDRTNAATFLDKWMQRYCNELRNFAADADQFGVKRKD